jgi:hypothetical protein
MRPFRGKPVMKAYLRNLLLALTGSPNYQPVKAAAAAPLRPLKIRPLLDTAEALKELATFEERFKAAQAVWGSVQYGPEELLAPEEQCTPPLVFPPVAVAAWNYRQTAPAPWVRDNYALAAPRLMTAK